jgi:hypothetical protein
MRDVLTIATLVAGLALATAGGPAVGLRSRVR